ncbi:sugar ABC transporter permease [Paenibacillus sp.]|uniref:carbohydrate ABC transporter permease n=1 Tax=Paenibacillus sp. TaxID=58172 RepID=UPI002D3D5051|nr:sugar ABC transporter permease [Paenibacillus sp.]HZG83377.1 sugar ABC transporter permease [Paenibacillus sp.]
MKPRTSIWYSQKKMPYVFIAPFIVSFFLFQLYPILNSFIMSFQYIVPGKVEFIGFGNYRNLWNPQYFQALKVSAGYTFWILAVLIPLPLLFAVWLNSPRLPGRNLFRSTLFIPALTSIIAAGAIFRLIFGTLETSLANSILVGIGMEPQKWTMRAGTGMMLMVLLSSWRWLGVNVLYFLSGLQNIPNDLYEAADIDGANAWNKFFRITLPLLKPVSIYVLTISIYGGLSMFTESYVFWSNKSPGDLGLTIVGYLYRHSFELFNLGFGSAIGVSLLFLVLSINLIQLKFFGLFGKGE